MAENSVVIRCGDRSVRVECQGDACRFFVDESPLRTVDRHTTITVRNNGTSHDRKDTPGLSLDCPLLAAARDRSPLHAEPIEPGRFLLKLDNTLTGVVHNTTVYERKSIELTFDLDGGEVIGERVDYLDVSS